MSANISISIGSLVAASKKRPAGYLEDCLAVGTVDHSGQRVTFTPEQYAAMVEKYRGSATAGPAVAAGPGTELSKMLKRFGIEPTPTCQCRAKARQMDAWGPDECARPERIEEVLAVMRDEAKARGLPFVDLAGRLLIRRAIANARRAASG